MIVQVLFPSSIDWMASILWPSQLNETAKSLAIGLPPKLLLATSASRPLILKLSSVKLAEITSHPSAQHNSLCPLNASLALTTSTQVLPLFPHEGINPPNHDQPLQRASIPTPLDPQPQPPNPLIASPSSSASPHASRPPSPSAFPSPAFRSVFGFRRRRSCSPAGFRSRLRGSGGRSCSARCGWILDGVGKGGL